MPGEKIRLPLKEELLNAMKVAETSTEAADYLVVRFTDILTKAKMLAESQDIIAKVQDYAKYVHFKLLSNAQPWSGESVPSSDFKNMQENLAKDLDKNLQSIEGSLQLDIAINDQGQLLRGYSADHQTCDFGQVDALDKLFNAWLAKNDVVSKGSMLHACDAEGEIVKQDGLEKTAEKIKNLIHDKKDGFGAYLEAKGKPIVINTCDYPDTQREEEKGKAVKAAIQSSPNIEVDLTNDDAAESQAGITSGG